jgi:hypothetical protein
LVGPIETFPSERAWPPDSWHGGETVNDTRHGERKKGGRQDLQFATCDLQLETGILDVKREISD